MPRIPTFQTYEDPFAAMLKGGVSGFQRGVQISNMIKSGKAQEMRNAMMAKRAEFATSKTLYDQAAGYFAEGMSPEDVAIKMETHMLVAKQNAIEAGISEDYVKEKYGATYDHDKMGARVAFLGNLFGGEQKDPMKVLKWIESDGNMMAIIQQGDKIFAKGVAGPEGDLVKGKEKKEPEYSKLKPSNYTVASFAKYKETGNHSDLVYRDKAKGEAKTAKVKYVKFIAETFKVSDKEAISLINKMEREAKDPTEKEMYMKALATLMKDPMNAGKIRTEAGRKELVDTAKELVQQSKGTNQGNGATGVFDQSGSPTNKYRWTPGGLVPK